MKLHLGCGERYLEGYTHIDLADFEHIDYKMPVDNLSIFENNSIDEIMLVVVDILQRKATFKK